MAVVPKKQYSRIPDIIKLPELIDIQVKAFEWFREFGLKELFDEITPIISFNKNLELHFF